MSRDLSSLWCLDPTVAYLNHGSFGACPRAVLEVQQALRHELEREPVAFLSEGLGARLDAARSALAAFVGASAADLVFVPNATTGVNAVLRSLRFAPGDELLVTTHTYAACRNAVDFVARDSGARIVVATLPFPVEDEAEILAAVLDRVSARTRLALLDHVTSPTALLLPIARLVTELKTRGVETLVDGAHAPGMVPLALDGLGAAYYTGNAHKWMCAPKGAAFLHVRADRHAGIHALVTSHGFDRGLQAEFDWTGTLDPTPYLCIPAAIETIGGLLPGGWPAVMAANHALVMRARALVLDALEVAPPAPEPMIGSLASIPLPAAARGAPAERLDSEALGAWIRARGVRTWLYPHPRPLVRLSAQLYNHIEEYARLAALLREALGRD